MTSRSQHAERSQIFVIRDVDVDPEFVDQIEPLLDTFVKESLHDSGIQTFALLSQTLTPTYFQLVEIFADLKAFDAHVSAQHTADFRNNTAGLLGPPYDGRLYRFVNGESQISRQQ